jgi:hypothetical protein
MGRLWNFFEEKCVNGGLPLVLMGTLWLLLWLFPWFQDYIGDNRWGHNYAESMAFLSVGLAYFNRKFFSDVLALLATLLIIPASLELIPPYVTAILAAVIVAFIIADIVAERKRSYSAASNQVTMFVQRYFPLFLYVLLAALPMIYFLVRVPAGTWETDIDTILFDALILPFLISLIIENITVRFKKLMKRICFFLGLGVMIVVLYFMLDEPVTWPVLGFVCLVFALGLISIWLKDRRHGSMRSKIEVV